MNVARTGLLVLVFAVLGCCSASSPGEAASSDGAGVDTADDRGAGATVTPTWCEAPDATCDSDCTPRSLVVLALATSGSMEYLAEAGAEEFELPQCEEPGTGPQLELGGYERSRLGTIQEALLGTTSEYWCQLQYHDDESQLEFGYPIPHARTCSGASSDGSCGAPVRTADGVLDAFADEVRLVLMTSDNTEDPAEDVTGAFSYGPEGGGLVNLGARNASWGEPAEPNVWDEALGAWSFSDEDREVNNRGQLLAAPLLADAAARTAFDRLLRYELGTLIGFWGDALSPLLMDAAWFLETDPAAAAYDDASGEGDPLVACRQRAVILVTDGRPSLGEGISDYLTTSEAIEQLQVPAAEGAPVPSVHVIGFGLDPTDLSVLEGLGPAEGGPADSFSATWTLEELRSSLHEVFELATSLGS